MLFLRRKKKIDLQTLAVKLGLETEPSMIICEISKAEMACFESHSQYEVHRCSAIFRNHTIFQ